MTICGDIGSRGHQNPVARSASIAELTINNEGIYTVIATLHNQSWVHARYSGEHATVMAHHVVRRLEEEKMFNLKAFLQKPVYEVYNPQGNYVRDPLRLMSPP